MRTYFSNGTLVAGLGNLPGGSNPNKSAAQPGTGPINNRTGQDYDPFEKGKQGSGDPLSIPVDEYDPENPPPEPPPPLPPPDPELDPQITKDCVTTTTPPMALGLQGMETD